MPYDPAAFEPKWQAFWREHEVFRSEIDRDKPKFYVLDMFPYPSGAGLHVGHPKGYIATDVLSRYKRMRGFSVLHPMGWDAFGLPAEQYAIETGTHPRETTRRNVDNFRRQFQSLGTDYDWSREIDTTDPGYVRWTQWIFRKLYEMDLAYLAEVPVNWCPALGTVLANEEVIDGRSERGGHPVTRVPMRQWMLRITRYADRLIDDLDGVDWPEPIKKMQRDWIGRSEGARILFDLPDHPGTRIEVFTTRPDTLFGATYMVLAPEHPLVEAITSDAQRDEVRAYVEQSGRRSERVRMAETHEKSGAFTGAYAAHPVTGQPIPVWIADYVLATYGTGAVMAVPAHDTRDHAFAKRFELPIVEVIAGGDVASEAYVSDGVNVNSDFLDGLSTRDAKLRMIEWLEAHGRGDGTINYKLRDWLFSRQRYWGEPFPILHTADGATKLVPESDLPVELPELADFKPSGDFEPPLARAREWLEVRDPDTGELMRRDANTMPQWAGSCWYYLRFCDPRNENAPWSKEAEDYWMPVDLYVGGAEHAVLHLLYSRFWHKVLFDLGLVHTVEPFQKLLNPGMILGYSYRYYDDNVTDAPDVVANAFPSSEIGTTPEATVHERTGVPVKARWVRADEIRWQDDRPMHPTIEGLALEEVTEKMSKSRGNVVNPDDVIAEYGTDAMRLYEMFLGPLDKGAPWSTDSIPGVYRFLQRAWRLIVDEDHDGNETLAELAAGAGTDDQARLTARTIAGVTTDIEEMQFNTAISKLMVFVRDIAKTGPLPRESAEAFLLLLSPFAPHIAEELWQRIGKSHSLALESWPEAAASLLVDETVTLAVQVNGKRRSEIVLAADADEAAAREAALADPAVARHLDGREPRKVIVVAGRLVNVVG